MTGPDGHARGLWWRVVLTLLPFGPAVLAVLVFSVLTALNSPLVTSYGFGRLLWVPVSFAVYYGVLVIPLLFFRRIPSVLAALPAAMLTPGLLILHLVPAFNQPAEGLILIATSDAVELVVNLPGMVVHHGLARIVEHRTWELSGQPPALLDALGTDTHTQIQSMTWHEDRLWLAVETSGHDFLAVVDADGSVTDPGFWGQGTLTDGLGSIESMLSTPNGLLLQAHDTLHRLTPEGRTELGELDALTGVDGGYLAMEPSGRADDAGVWMRRYDWNGRVVRAWGQGSLVDALNIGEDLDALLLAKVGEFPDGVALRFSFHPEGRAGTLVVHADGSLQGLPLVGETVHPLEDGGVLLASGGSMVHVDADGHVVREVPELRSPLGLFQGRVVARDDGWSSTDPTLDDRRPWLEGRLDGWRPVISGGGWRNGVDTPEGRVLALRPGGDHSRKWRVDAQGPIAPLIRLDADGTPDPSFNPRYPLPD